MLNFVNSTTVLWNWQRNQDTAVTSDTVHVLTLSLHLDVCVSSLSTADAGPLQSAHCIDVSQCQPCPAVQRQSTTRQLLDCWPATVHTQTCHRCEWRHVPHPYAHKPGRPCRSPSRVRQRQTQSAPTEATLLDDREAGGSWLIPSHRPSLASHSVRAMPCQWKRSDCREPFDALGDAAPSCAAQQTQSERMYVCDAS